MRSGGSYISQNDLRVHFGLGKAEKADLIEIRWPSGQVDTLKDVKANQLIVVEEGKGIVKTQALRNEQTQVANNCESRSDRVRNAGPRPRSRDWVRYGLFTPMII